MISTSLNVLFGERALPPTTATLHPGLIPDHFRSMFTFRSVHASPLRQLLSNWGRDRSVLVRWRADGGEEGQRDDVLVPLGLDSTGVGIIFLFKGT